MLAQFYPEFVGTHSDIVPAHRSSKCFILELLLDGFSLHSLEFGRPHKRYRGNEPTQLVDREQRLRHQCLAWDAGIRRVPENRGGDIITISFRLQHVDPHERMLLD